MFEKRFNLIFVILLIIVLSAGCSSNIKNDNVIKDNSTDITGKINQNVNQNLSHQQTQLDSINNADEIWAFPLKFHASGRADLDFIDQKQTFSIKENGSFKIDVEDLDNSNQYVFVLADSDADIENRIINFLAVKGGENNLNSIIVSDITKDINLGNIDQQGNEAVSEKNIVDISESFSTVSRIGLNDMAHADNVVTVIKNHYINYKKYDIPYKGYYDYTANIGSIKANEYTDIFNLKNSKLRFSFWTQIESDVVDNRKLISPTGEEFPINPSHPDGRIYWNYSKLINDKVSNGYWTFREANGKIIGKYDFNINNPVDKDGYLLGYIPTFKINTNDNGLIKNISLKWYLNKSNGEIKEVKNVELVDKMVQGAFMQYNNGDSSGGGNWHIDVTDKTIEIPSRYGDVYLSDLEQIKFDYGIMGSTFALYLK